MISPDFQAKTILFLAYQSHVISYDHPYGSKFELDANQRHPVEPVAAIKQIPLLNFFPVVVDARTGHDDNR